MKITKVFNNHYLQLNNKKTGAHHANIIFSNNMNYTSFITLFQPNKNRSDVLLGSIFGRKQHNTL